jgi:D-glycero-D-manno-heptose 1,7-bisphosphate phosphatase
LPGLDPSGVVFLDRDGTINTKAPDGDYVKRPVELKVLPGAARAIRRLNDAGVTVIIVSNQRGIALGRMTEADLAAVHSELADTLQTAAGAHVDAIFHCPHDLGQCDCRKPGIGMFTQARERFPWIDLNRSVMIGDSASDIEAGTALGMRTVWVGRDVPDLAGAVDEVLGRA